MTEKTHTSSIRIESLIIEREDHGTIKNIDLTVTAKHNTPGREGTILSKEIKFNKPGHHASWNANIEFNDLPKTENIEDTSKKLGEWLERIGIALQENDISTIDIESLR